MQEELDSVQSQASDNLRKAQAKIERENQEK